MVNRRVLSQNAAPDMITYIEEKSWWRWERERDTSSRTPENGWRSKEADQTSESASLNPIETHSTAIKYYPIFNSPANTKISHIKCTNCKQIWQIGVQEVTQRSYLVKYWHLMLNKFQGGIMAIWVCGVTFQLNRLLELFYSKHAERCIGWN